jgi:hypothetical protein
MRPLRKYLVGEKITADMINGIVDSIRESQVNSVVGGTFKRSAGGTTIAINSPPKTAAQSSPTISYPFEYYSGGTATGPWFGLRAGTVNGVLPTNWTTTFSLPVSTTAGYTRYVDLNCQTNGSAVNAINVELNSTPPTPMIATADSAPPTFKINTHVVINGEAYRTIGASSIMAVVQESIRVDKATVAYGLKPWTQYYIWAFAS